MLATLATFQDMFALIFGDILAVNRGELQLLLGLAVLVVILLLTFNRELELTALDPAYASSIGLSPDLARTGLLVLVAFAVVAGITAVGIVLTASLPNFFGISRIDAFGQYLAPLLYFGINRDCGRDSGAVCVISRRSALGRVDCHFSGASGRPSLVPTLVPESDGKSHRTRRCRTGELKA